MKPFNIRDNAFRIAARAADLESVLKTFTNIERIDVWLGQGDDCQIGLCWGGGSTAIFDFPDQAGALKIFSDGISKGWPAPIIHAARSKA